MLVIKGFLILDNENREYSAYSGSGELCPARGPNGSFKSLSLAEPGPTPSHITSASQHISPSQSLRIVTTVFSFWLSFPNPPSLPLTLSLSHSLQCVSLLASRAALGRAGRGVTSCCPQLAQTAWPGLQRFSVSHADMQQHAALGCCMHNQPDLKGLRNMGAFI